jgi:hypothetical protein
MAAIGKSSFFKSLGNSETPISFIVHHREKKEVKYTYLGSDTGIIQRPRDDARYVLITCGTYAQFVLSPAELDTLQKTARVNQEIMTRAGQPKEIREFCFSEDKEGQFMILELTLNPNAFSKHQFLEVKRYTFEFQALPK